MSPVRLTLSALGAPVTGRVRGLRRRLRARRAWKAGAPPIPDQAALPEPFLYGDGDVGRALVAGRWLARGHEVELGERPIWAVPLPDPRLEADRDAFEWLGALAALGTRAARSRAQAWTLDWVRRFGRGRGPGWRPERAGRRMLNWTAQLRLMTEGLPAEDAARVWRAVATHGRVLGQVWREAPEGAGQVAALTGSVLGLALVGDEAADAAAIELAQLSEQVIDGVGATPSRAPGELADMVILLIWTARVLEGAGMAARPGHLHAIARAVPVIRALRLGDGSMARFHGGGPGRPERLDQALAELRLAARAKPRLPMGYARLAGGRLVAVMDGAAPPMGPGARAGAAGTLAFELTAGRVPLVVNAGPGHVFGPGAGVAARATAAHSTVEIDGAASARLCRPGLAARAYGGWLEEGPSLVSVRQAQDHTGQWLLATHDGYVETHGLLHERRLFVDSRGTECRGEEIVYVTDGRAQKRFDGIAKQRRRPVLMTAHFHLHPDVAASVDPVRQVIELSPPGIDTWLFRAAGGRVELRDGWYFDPEAAAPTQTLQIVVIAEIVEYLGQINWSFTRAAPKTVPAPAGRAALVSVGDKSP
jgi:uncharacterized heparinase superfamily protein